MPRRSLPVATLQPGERVRIDLKGRKRSGIYCYTGRVVATDAVAVRLERVIAMQSYGQSLPYGRHLAGAVLVPWSSVQSIRIDGERQPS